MKIAISLITHNDLALLKPSLDSLFNSDLNNHSFKLFVCDNNSTIELTEYLSRLEVPKHIIFNPTNEGIVIPRIKIYDEIIKEDFDFLLEIHSDMIFPAQWLDNLLEVDDENVGILQPHIHQPTKIITLEEFENKLHELLGDKIYDNCRQVHPWLIKLKNIDKIGGYYDDIFSPQEYEDDDFAYRVVKHGFSIRSTSNSWVCHYGGLTRHKVLRSYNAEHRQLFEKKHGILFTEAIKLFKYHPAFR